jgi:predicted phage terminase large subunit-like protein
MNNSILERAKHNARIALSRREFWQYCKFTSPDFYKQDRIFLQDLAEKLQWFIEEAEEQIMVVNMPPRHGKSRTATKFVQWLFGKYGAKIKVMTGSYNETLSSTFAKQVRDCIAEQPTLGVTVYNDIFPDTNIKYGEAAVQKWALEGSQQANYLATSPTGTATGFGCNIMIIDDLIKNAEEAYNENTLKKLQSWFTDTMLSRTENGFKIIVIMTRWSSDDLAGFILQEYENVVHINYKAVQADGTMLCPAILSKADYSLKTKNMNKDIVAANYQQEPIDVKGRLYTNIKTYKDIPKDDEGNPLFTYILNYTDTADEGSDFLCSICYGVYNQEYYVLDVYYTKEAMEITEPATAKMLKKHNVGCAIIESNNGGRGFARNVERECRAMGNYHTNIKWFHQSKNKTARILSNSTSVMNNIYFPLNWEDRFPEFARDIKKYQREGKNAHDDAPDALTGVYENPKPKGITKLNRNIQGGV